MKNSCNPNKYLQKSKMKQLHLHLTGVDTPVLDDEKSQTFINYNKNYNITRTLVKTKAEMGQIDPS